MIAGIIAAVVLVAAILLYKGTSGGPVVGTPDDLPPSVKAALLGENKGHGQPGEKKP